MIVIPPSDVSCRKKTVAINVNNQWTPNFGCPLIDANSDMQTAMTKFILIALTLAALGSALASNNNAPTRLASFPVSEPYGIVADDVPQYFSVCAAIRKEDVTGYKTDCNNRQ